MTLPIDLIPGTRPQRFRWRQFISTPIGPKTVHHEGAMPPMVEPALVELIALVKQQAQEIIGYQRTIGRLEDQLATKIEVANIPAKKGKG